MVPHKVLLTRWAKNLTKYRPTSKKESTWINWWGSLIKWNLTRKPIGMEQSTGSKPTITRMQCLIISLQLLRRNSRACYRLKHISRKVALPNRMTIRRIWWWITTNIHKVTTDLSKVTTYPCIKYHKKYNHPIWSNISPNLCIYQCSHYQVMVNHKSIMLAVLLQLVVLQMLSRSIRIRIVSLQNFLHTIQQPRIHCIQLHHSRK